MVSSLEPIRTIQIFQRQPDPRQFAAGQVIFEQGQTADVMYGLVEGEVEIRVQGKVLETLMPGAAFGVGALIGDKIRRHTAIALTDCTLAYLDEERFLFAVQETPMFALEIMRTYANRLDRVAQLTTILIP